MVPPFKHWRIRQSGSPLVGNSAMKCQPQWLQSRSSDWHHPSIRFHSSLFTRLPHNMSMPPPPPPPERPVTAPAVPVTGTKSPNKSPSLRPLTAANAAAAPGALADAISKIDSLRLSQPPSATNSPPTNSGASSPGLPTRTRTSIVSATSGDGKFQSPPQTPHFGAQSDL